MWLLLQMTKITLKIWFFSYVMQTAAVALFLFLYSFVLCCQVTV